MSTAHVLGHLWALPVSMAGALVAWVGGARYVKREGPCFLFATKDGAPLAAFFRESGMSAFTWGGVVVLAGSAFLANTRLLAHEKRHTVQAMVFGPLMPVAYGVGSLWALVRGGKAYKDNPLEIDARKAESP